jgi:hypothetical protein
MQTWLPKKSSLPLDGLQKPYYCESKFKRQRRLATTVLFGLAPVLAARAAAANHREASLHAGKLT